jgi:hypothetical protein
MDCNEFVYTIQHFNPEDLSQVERIAVICHLQECEDCCKFVGELIKNLKEVNPKMKRLALADKELTN